MSLPSLSLSSTGPSPTPTCPCSGGTSPPGAGHGALERSSDDGSMPPKSGERGVEGLMAGHWGGGERVLWRFDPLSTQRILGARFTQTDIPLLRRRYRYWEWLPSYLRAGAQ